MTTGHVWVGRRSTIFFESRKKTAILILLALVSSVFSTTLINGITEVHGQGGFEYTLSNSGGILLAPGESGTTTIVAALISGTPSNVTLTCDLTNLPQGTTCSFSPASLIPTLKGNTTILTMSVPTTVHYAEFNVTVSGKSQAPLTPTILTLTVGAKVALSPTQSGSLGDIPGRTSVTVSVNITDAPAFGAFEMGIFYNNSVLNFQSLDYSNNVFGSDFFVSSECTDHHDVFGSGNACLFDKTYDAVGVVSLVIATNSGNNYNVNGTLFSVSFSLVSSGFSAIHFVHQVIKSEPDGVPLRSASYDGYYTNKDCGGSNLCKPPVLSIIPPLRPVEYRPATFDSTASSQNPNGLVKEYNWTWGGAAPQFYNSIYTNASITFNFVGEFDVTLSVQDNFGARAYNTVAVNVFRVWTDLGLSNINIDNSVGILPGTPVHIVTYAFNNGVNPENSTLRLAIDGKNVTAQSVMNLQPDKTLYLNYTWQTSNLSPRVYRIDVSLDEVRDPTSGHILENDTFTIRGRQVDPNNHNIAFVQIISPVPGNFGLLLGLNLPETLGLAIVVVAVAGFVFGIIKKARAPPPEPL